MSFKVNEFKKESDEFFMIQYRSDETLCNCGYPFHPNTPCSEIVAYSNHTDSEYFRVIHNVLDKGKTKKNRTGIDTIETFGEQMKYEVKLNAFPILTTKKVWFKGVVHELLWFLSGNTNIKYLVDNDVHIWDEWAYTKYLKVMKSWTDPLHSQSAFIESIKNNEKYAAIFGDLGEGTYGSMWRAFPYHSSGIEFVEGCGPEGLYYEREEYIDQIKNVLETLKTDPDSRRMIVSAWHPYLVNHCALPPCHCFFQFGTEELNDWERSWISNEYGQNLGMTSVHEMNEQMFNLAGIPKRKLHLSLYVRSMDLFLGCPFNLTSYSLLLAMVAQCVNMQPGTLTISIGSAHIYKNHLQQIDLQLGRDPKKLPKLWLNPEKKDLFSFTFDDIRLENYDCHPTIKGEVAV